MFSCDRVKFADRMYPWKIAYDWTLPMKEKDLLQLVVRGSLKP